MNNELGVYIKNAREKMGISQRELARRIDVDNKTINNIERGLTKKVAFDILVRLSQKLEVSIIELGNLANYTPEEIKEEMWDGLSLTHNIFDGYLVDNYFQGDEKIEKYMYTDEDNSKFIDIVKVLEGYKNNELTKIETIVLINACKPLEYVKDKLIYPTEQGNIQIDL